MMEELQKVFKDTKGDIKSVTKAILLDPEAREGTHILSRTYGHLKEPLLMLSTVFRAFNVSSINNQYPLGELESPIYFGQNPYRAPSVFNFFNPEFSSSGEISKAGLVSPEFKIHTDVTSVSRPNLFQELIYLLHYNRGIININLNNLQSKGFDTRGIIDYLDHILLSNMMNTSTKEIISQALNEIPESEEIDRIKTAVYLTIISPDFAV